LGIDEQKNLIYNLFRNTYKGGVYLSQVNEYFSSTEIKKVDEHKRFTAERYLKVTDYNPTAKELPQKGKEFFDSGTQQSATKRKSTLGQKLRKKMAQGTAKTTTTTVATTVAAAVGSVVVLSTMFAPTPNIDLPQLDVGQDYVTYTIVADDLQEEMYYFVEISNPYDTYTNDLVEGENTQTVTGLRQGMAYNLAVKGVDEQKQTSTTYFKQSFYTTANKATTFTLADTLRLSGENVYSVDYALTNEVDQSIVIDQMYFYVTFDNLPEEKLECYYPAYNGVGSFEITVPWGTTSLQMYATAYVSTADGVESYQTSSLTYAVDTAPTLHLLDTRVHLHDNDYNNSTEVDLTFAYSAPEGSNVIVQDVSAASVTDAIYTWYNGTYEIALGQTDSDTLHTFSYYLVDSDGNQLTTPQHVTVDSSITGEYQSFNYSNPGDVTKTYTKHGDGYLTNLYINLNFSTTDPDVYYQIAHSAYGYETYYTSRQPIAAIENTYESTGFEYFVCKDVNDITYVLYYVVPSGATDDSTAWNLSCNVVANEADYLIEVAISNAIKFTTEGMQIKIVYEDETQQIFKVDADDVVYSEDSYQHVISITTTQEPFEVWLAVGTNSAYNDYDLINQQIETIGTPYKYEEHQLYGG